jgi:hypothetical protein
MADFDAWWARINAETAVWAHDLEAWQASVPPEGAPDAEWDAFRLRARELWDRWEGFFDSVYEDDDESEGDDG